MTDFVEVHADDYGISRHASTDILSCIKAGKLDSISVLTNMTAYEEAASELVAVWNTLVKKPLLTIHMNFMEGHCVADPASVPHLVNEKGYFAVGFGKLLAWSYVPAMYQIVKQELKTEIKAQTERFIQYFGTDRPLRFDGHQHTQMIPVVYHALLELIQEEQYPVSYIRVTREPIRAYLKMFSLWTTYAPINWVKNGLLNLFSPFLESKLSKVDWKYEHTSTGERRNTIPCKRMYLWGVVMSGCMDERRVNKLLANMCRQSERRHRHLEILFHPGSLIKEEMGEEFCNVGANNFHLSQNRSKEFEAVMELNL